MENNQKPGDCKEYVFNLADFAEYVKNVRRAYHYNILEDRKYIINSLRPADSKLITLTPHELPEKLTSLEEKIKGVFPFYLRGVQVSKVERDSISNTHV